VEAAVARPRLSGLLILVAVAVLCGRILSVLRVYEPNLFRSDRQMAAAEVLPLGAGSPLEIAGAFIAGQETWGRTYSADPRPLWPRTRPEPMPTFSSNDRARWATVRALVDEGTYVIGRRDPTKASPQNRYGDEGIIFRDGWQTIDVVLNPTTQEFYSSKPPLLPTLVAGEYWLLQKLFGWTLEDQPFAVVRVVLLTVNVLPFFLYLLLLAHILERYGSTEWGRYYVLAAAAFGTLLTPFALTLNNHSVAAFSVLFALYPALRIWREREDGCARSYWFALAGLFAGFAACNELPALAFTALLFLVLLVRAPRRTLVWFLPALAVPVAAFFLTNYLALGQLRPVQSEFGGAWYDYPGSHWHTEPGKVRRGIDFAGQKESRATYAFHLLLGHHGLFSLTPVFLLALVAMGLALIARRPDGRSAWPPLLRGRVSRGPQTGLLLVSGMTLGLTVIVVGFYLVETSNYGGWSAGPRWLMWLTPLWLITTVPVVDRMASCRWGRGLSYLLLGLSVMAASYPAWNPWRQPWIYNFMEARGWINY
jgi:hypothetical protein